MKQLLTLFLLVCFASFSSAQQTKKSKNTVPVSIIISADQTSASQIDLPVYTSQILAELNKSQNAEFVLVDPDSNPEVIIDIKVSNLKIGQRIQRSNNKTVPTSRVTGTDANGRPTSFPGVLIREETIVERNSSANFTTTLKVARNTSSPAEKEFNSLYSFSQTTATTPGDRISRSTTILKPKQLSEPKTEEFLLLLSKKDLTGYLAGELRKTFSLNGQTKRTE
ncbi:hypothetical protein [Daejeonella lutea]|uniref:TonB-dependent Receptor Plug Domain n=1 Tax=Daejeonella lutea TaxID=572036 RepID=A0A1T5DR03_9SPHI|nr:hypothetical protein [Daejeonella lutea]SKB74207.1 hypothetical protein SAMN05661099_2536 [Daejeonella lutea]